MIRWSCGCPIGWILPRPHRADCPETVVNMRDQPVEAIGRPDPAKGEAVTRLMTVDAMRIAAEGVRGE